MPEGQQQALLPQPFVEPSLPTRSSRGAALAPDDHSPDSSLPVLVRMRSVSIEIYRGPCADERDGVIVIDMTQPTHEITQGCIQEEIQGEKEALADRGMSSYRAGRNARTAGSMVNIYI